MPERDDQAKSNATQLALNTDLNTKWITIPGTGHEQFCEVDTNDKIVFYLPPCDHDFPGVCNESHTWFTVYYPSFSISDAASDEPLDEPSEEPIIIHWVTGYTTDSKLALNCAKRISSNNIKWHVMSQDLNPGELEVAIRATSSSDRGWNDEKTCTCGCLYYRQPLS
jgi:hypothetical protein